MLFAFPNENRGHNQLQTFHNCCELGIVMEKTQPQAKLQEEDWLEIEF